MSLSRRDFFRRGLAEAVTGAARAAASVGNAVLPPPAAAPPAPRPLYLRPPGALPEGIFVDVCTRCDDCLVACPRESIRKAGHELGELVEGTPVILPDAQPCWLCADLPCISACQVAALRPLESPAAARIGRISIDEERCYAFQGSICDVCAERCPVRPKPIRVPWGAGPEVDPDACTGCAVCAWLCPAGAIDVSPA